MSLIPQQQPRRSTMSIWGLMEVGGLLLCAATVAGFLARLWWVFELASHFRLHLAVGLSGLAAVWALKRRWRMASICGLCATANAVLVLMVLLPAETTDSQNGIRLRLVSINVHTENQRSDLVLKFLQTADADVILLMEVNEAWMNALQPLRANYTQMIAKPREDNFGIALFSRLPLTNSEVIELGKAEVPSIATTISVGGQGVFLLGTHPLPPGSAEYARLRNEQLQEIAALIRRRGMAAIVLGDLNCTPWSPYFKDLLRDGGLKNTSQRRGLFGSWPAWLPFGRIPLDHGLVSQTIRIIEKRVGPPVGSDHLPLILELQIPTEDRVHISPDH
ncbi:MAG TPA: endonuclease/exonuclease/phosphatase family protein [Verrucomicrobiae bacterium]